MRCRKAGIAPSERTLFGGDDDGARDKPIPDASVVRLARNPLVSPVANSLDARVPIVSDSATAGVRKATLVPAEDSAWGGVVVASEDQTSIARCCVRSQLVHAVDLHHICAEPVLSGRG